MQAYAEEAVAVLRLHAVADEDRVATALHTAARARVQLGALAARIQTQPVCRQPAARGA